MCRTAAATKKGPSQTQADAKWQLCISLSGTDSWQMDSTHTLQEKRQRMHVCVCGGGVREKEKEREKAPRMIHQHCSLFWGPAFDWVLQRIINPPLPSAVPSFLSPPYPSLSLFFFSSLNSLLLSSTLLLLPLLWHFALVPLFWGSYSPGPSPAPRGISLCFSLSLCSTFHLSAIGLYLPSWCICLSLSEVWETRVRGSCQTNQQYSLTAIPLWIWLCI